MVHDIRVSWGWKPPKSEKPKEGKKFEIAGTIQFYGEGYMLNDIDMIKLIEKIDKSYYDKHNIKEHLKDKYYESSHEPHECRKLL
eukprot:UN28210